MTNSSHQLNSKHISSIRDGQGWWTVVVLGSRFTLIRQLYPNEKQGQFLRAFYCLTLINRQSYLNPSKFNTRTTLTPEETDLRRVISHMSHCLCQARQVACHLDSHHKATISSTMDKFNSETRYNFTWAHSFVAQGLKALRLLDIELQTQIGERGFQVSNSSIQLVSVKLPQVVTRV